MQHGCVGLCVGRWGRSGEDGMRHVSRYQGDARQHYLLKLLKLHSLRTWRIGLRVFVLHGKEHEE